MEVQTTLSTIAEVAITLAGFTGLVIGLAPTRNDTKQALFRVSAIITACFVLIITALLPSAFMQIGYSEDLTFGIPLILLGVGYIGVGFTIFVAGKRGVFLSPMPRFSLFLRAPSFLLALYIIAAPVCGWASSLPALLVFASLWFMAVTGAYFMLSILWIVTIQSEVEEHKIKTA
jgi:hypothetical protein